MNAFQPNINGAHRSFSQSDIPRFDICTVQRIKAAIEAAYREGEAVEGQRRPASCSYRDSAHDGIPNAR